MEAAINYYPFHIGDYLSATRHLSWEEDAAFRRLLDTYYTTEKPLPADLRAVCRLVLATTDSQREAVRVVLEEFFRLTEEGYVNTRADAEIAAMREKQQKQRDKANKRWHKPSAEHGNASAMPRHEYLDAAASEKHADAMPPTPTPTPTPKEEIHPLPPSGELPAKPAAEAQATPTIPCPYEAIVAAYHEALPSLPRVRLMTASRQRAMRNRWGWVLRSLKPDGTKRANTAEEALQWFAAFFARAAENDWLCGRTPRSAGHEAWTADIDFLLGDKGLRHVVEKTRDAA